LVVIHTKQIDSQKEHHSAEKGRFPPKPYGQKGEHTEKESKSKEPLRVIGINPDLIEGGNDRPNGLKYPFRVVIKYHHDPEKQATDDTDKKENVNVLSSSLFLPYSPGKPVETKPRYNRDGKEEEEDKFYRVPDAVKGGNIMNELVERCIFSKGKKDGNCHYEEKDRAKFFSFRGDKIKGGEKKRQNSKIQCVQI
jgi:hypothetical protein